MMTIQAKFNSQKQIFLSNSKTSTTFSFDYHFVKFFIFFLDFIENPVLLVVFPPMKS